MSVLVAVPCYAGLLTVAGHRSLHEISVLGASLGVPVDFLVTHGESAITRGRSNIVSFFLREGDWGTLAMLDADIYIKSEDFWSLYNLEQPIRGAAVATKTLDHSEALSVYKDGKRVKRADMPTDPFEVDYLGGSVMLVERDVLSNMSAAYPELAYDDPIAGPGVHLFLEIVSNRVLLSEDYAFCERARDCGFSIWCDPSVIVDHFDGRVSWSF